MEIFAIRGKEQTQDYVQYSCYENMEFKNISVENRRIYNMKHAPVGSVHSIVKT